MPISQYPRTGMPLGRQRSNEILFKDKLIARLHRYTCASVCVYKRLPIRLEKVSRSFSSTDMVDHDQDDSEI